MAESQIAAQLYTLRDFTQTQGDIAKTMKRVKEIGYDAVQCSALGPIAPEELKKIVDGEGVIGKKPIIEPGDFFEYKSFCPLNTNFGYMKGFYTLRDEKGKVFKAQIPQFGLISPSFIN